MAMVTDGLSNTTLFLEHAGYDKHYVKGVGWPMPDTDLTLDQPGAWGAWLGWCAFQVQGYYERPLPADRVEPTLGDRLRDQLQQLAGRLRLPPRRGERRHGRRQRPDVLAEHVRRHPDVPGQSERRGDRPADCVLTTQL